MQIEDLMQRNDELLGLCRLVLEQNPELKRAGFYPFINRGQPYLINSMHTAGLFANFRNKLLIKEYEVEGRPDAPKVYVCLPPPEPETMPV